MGHETGQVQIRMSLRLCSDPADVSHYGELGSNGKQQQQPPTLLLRDNDKWWSTKHTGLIYRTWEAFNAIHCEGMDGEDSQR